jgi:alpha-glucosidase
MVEQKARRYFLMILVLIAEQGFSQPLNLLSPDGKLKVVVHAASQNNVLVYYDLFYGGAVLKNAAIGFELKALSSSFTFLRYERRHIASSWQTVYGERKNIPENYNQALLRFQSKSDPSLQVAVSCRAYNEGFAFQYLLRYKNKEILLTKELSKFPLPQDGTAWVSTTAQGILEEKKIKDINGVVERPLTVKLNDKVFLALGEAGLVSFARMKFFRNEKNILVSKLDGEVKAKDSLVSPWRYILVGKTPADLLQKNYLVLNLNEPNQIKNIKWIKPGKVIREATLTTTGAFNCIDFAARHNLQYILFDAGWYGKEDSDSSDATRVSIDPARYRGPLDLKRVIAYANQKNIGVILYVNRRALERQLDTLLPLYQSWGVKGLKFGFVQVGSQQWTTWLHEAIRKAAKYKMIVDVHDEYRSTGYSRTYPNLLTQEGIRGDEESPPTEHSITTLFTRMIAGAADNTNCYFTNRVARMGSHAAQLAKTVCIYSPLQFLFWYDRPVPDSIKAYKEGEIQEVPEMSWFRSLPAVWDKTLVLEGNMTDYATIARKKNNDWFLGSLNGTSERTIKLTCSFLDKNKKYIALIYTDDAAINNATEVKITSKKVDCNSVLSFTIAARSGLAMHFAPEKK